MQAKSWPPCEVCRKTVTTDDAELVITEHELDRYAEEKARWKKEHSIIQQVPESGLLESLGFVDPSDLPKRAHWRWGHITCLPDGHYIITTDRFDTLGKALDWTLHMMEKAWFPSTDWVETVRRLHDVHNA